jgi:hypothetical protein
MGEIRLLVERGLVQAERVDDVDDGLRLVLGTLISLLGRGVGADVDVLVSDSDLFAVGLVDYAIDLLEVIRVGDDLVTSDKVLQREESVQLVLMLWSLM